MAIPEKQLETWTALGAEAQSAQTHQTIKATLNDANSPYYSKSFTIFLQGSYGNETNVWKDSDVDIVMCLEQTYFSDITGLSPDAKANYDKVDGPATYSLNDFKADVLAWLQKKYPGAVKLGKKAIFIKGSGNRRDADLLVCARLRRYLKESNGADSLYEEGICFFLPDGTRIENFPEQHAANLTSKHQNTDEWLKPMVRIYKNMRNRMIDDGALDDGIAPSYFLEGMLWNVPKDKFGESYGDTWVNTFNWVLQTDHAQLACANDLHWLIRDNSQICWSTSNFIAYLNAAHKYWTEWGE
jgi:hypothetical protein